MDAQRLYAADRRPGGTLLKVAGQEAKGGGSLCMCLFDCVTERPSLDQTGFDKPVRELTERVV